MPIGRQTRFYETMKYLGSALLGIVTVVVATPMPTADAGACSTSDATGNSTNAALEKRTVYRGVS